MSTSVLLRKTHMTAFGRPHKEIRSDHNSRCLCTATNTSSEPFIMIHVSIRHRTRSIVYFDAGFFFHSERALRAEFDGHCNTAEYVGIHDILRNTGTTELDIRLSWLQAYSCRPPLRNADGDMRNLQTTLSYVGCLKESRVIDQRLLYQTINVT
ncbi:hypothetical protein A0H81_13996 [Grifola frondosa]|uniref:Uncharacterized protein n=1 Tax=Grifola frondosa TaxID=5627 RepID=A0A1C7LPU1_GRIFR|nr:hypothetical protein A0H81_13996 [Grifola frondosa]